MRMIRLRAAMIGPVGGHRRLFDQDFLDAGCPSDLYDEDTSLDNLPWTYGTNFAIAGAALFFAVALWFSWKSQSPKSLNESDELSAQDSKSGLHASPSRSPFPIFFPSHYFSNMILFFAFNFFGYFISGLGHLIFENEEDDETGLLLVNLFTQFTVGTASVIWIAAFVTEYKYAIQEGRGKRKMTGTLWWIYIATAILVLCALMVVRSLVLLGTFIGLSCVLAAVSSLWQYKKFNHWVYLLEVLASVCYIAGLILQVALNECGSDQAYETCFKNCVLSNPEEFNNNAVFHILALVFVILYGFCKMVLFRRYLTSFEVS